MALLKNGQIVEDGWIFVADDDPIPETGPVAITLDRYLAGRESFLARAGAIGLVLSSDRSPRAFAGDVGRFNLICLDFPKFTDGRPYSAARLLRERYGFCGELRATGNVLRDQLGFMWRCGFDAFVIPDGVDPGRWLGALNEVTVHKQPAADGPANATPLRHPRRGGEEAGTATPGRSDDRAAAMWAY